MERARRLLGLAVLAIVALSATALGASPKSADTASAPVIVASGTGEVRDVLATIGVALGARDLHTRVYAEYGTTAAYGKQTPDTQVPPGDDVQAVYRILNQLEPATTYHFRWVASNTAGQVTTPDQTFTTSGDGKAGDAGPAVQGLFISVSRASGKVRVRRAGRHRFTGLSGARGLAVGSVVDARHGKVRVTSALPNGSSQTATFHGGRFQVRQTAADGRIDVYLRGGSFRHCSSAARASADGPLASSSRKRRRHRRIRSLWGSDSSGLYSTYGLNSVATVRGTRWLTVDRCDGTLTRVTKGAVRVRDRRTGRTKVVTAGHSYLARRAR